jgi:KaiC/GvpD/RAD55 family RecA-like ATPase
MGSRPLDFSSGYRDRALFLNWKGFIVTKHTVQGDISAYHGVKEKPVKTTSWGKAIINIRSGKYEEPINSVRSIRDSDAYRRAKTKLPSVTFGGVFSPVRNKKNIKLPTGFIVADIDHLQNAKKVFNDLTDDEHVWFAFISPGGDGIKCGLRSETVSCDAEHKQFYSAVERYFQDVYDISIDPACKDISRLTFMSCDPGAYVNESACYFDHSEWSETLDPEPRPATSTTETNPKKQKYGAKVLAGACDKIRNSQPGNQHQTRLEQATLTGGFISTGYIDRGRALNELERAVSDSGAQDMRAAMKDITDGIIYGEAKPLDPIEEQAAEREAIQNEPPGEKPAKASAKNLAELMGGFAVERTYTSKIGSEEWLMPNLIIKNHILTLIAESGGGKTSFFFFHAARHIAERGATVYYVDADSPPSEHKMMMEFREKHGFNWIIPDVNEGKSVELFVKTLRDMADSQTDLEDAVFIFDTLKKFVDLMGKNSVKKFYTLMRRLTKLGATIVLLGHANKYRDTDGNLIPEGVGDVKSDTDELIFFSHQPAHDNGTDVTTMVDSSVGAKVRGLFKPFSFHINKCREISFYDQVKTPIELSDISSPPTDADILDTAAEYLGLMAEPVRQNRLVEYVRDKVEGSAGINRVRKLIVQGAVKKGDHRPLGTRFVYTVGERNIHLYELPEGQDNAQRQIWS